MTERAVKDARPDDYFRLARDQCVIDQAIKMLDAIEPEKNLFFVLHEDFEGALCSLSLIRDVLYEFSVKHLVESVGGEYEGPA